MKPKKSLLNQQIVDDFYDRQGNRCIAYKAGSIMLCEKRNIRARIEVYTNPRIYLVSITPDADEINMRQWIVEEFRQGIIDYLTRKFDIGRAEIDSLAWAEPSQQYEDSLTLRVH